MAKKNKTGPKSARKNFFIALGTHPQQFNRLLREIDRLFAGKKIPGAAFAQTGHSDYGPKNFEWQKFMGLAEFEKKARWADIVITHAGEGNVGICKNLGRKMIVVPRRREFGEHTNDHQLELAQVVQDKRLGLVAWNLSELEERLLQIERFVPAKIPRGKISMMLDDYVKRELGW